MFRCGDSNFFFIKGAAIFSLFMTSWVVAKSKNVRFSFRPTKEHSLKKKMLVFFFFLNAHQRTSSNNNGTFLSIYLSIKKRVFRWVLDIKPFLCNSRQITSCSCKCSQSIYRFLSALPLVAIWLWAHFLWWWDLFVKKMSKQVFDCGWRIIFHPNTLFP